MAISDLVVIMKDGNLMQIGTPRQIYEYPESTFVANFIGKANFITAEYQGKDGTAAAVKIAGELWTIPNPGKAAVQAGQPCALAFRPESVKLSKTERGVAGVVKRVTFLGTNVEYELEAAGATLVIQIYNPQLYENYAEGETVHAVLDLECVRVLAGSENVF